RPVFADTLIEDDDLYRFLKDLERHFQQPLTVLKDGRDPFQVFRDVRFLGNSRVDPCSKILKRELLETFTLSCPAPRIRVYGMKADEDDRRERLRRRVQNDICWFP